jgi:SpoIID/LytB domain protein
MNCIRLLRCLLVLLVAGSAVVIPASSAEALAPETIIVEGRGWGHGRGLQQWGALGYAVNYGWKHEQILQHFYSGTVVSATENSDVRVQVSGNDRQDVLITSGSPYTVEGVQFQAGEVVRIVAVGPSNFSYRKTTGCDNPGVDVATNQPGRLHHTGKSYVEAIPASVDMSVDDLNQLLVLIRCVPGNPTLEFSRRHYRGAIGMVEIGGQYTFNRVPMEEYLRGVVQQEMPSYWGTEGGGSGMEALKAQAVAARTYLLAISASRLANNYFTDTCDTISCQVYGGAAINGVPIDFGETYWTTTSAVRATAGQILISPDGSIPLTEFGSSSGGYTAPLEENSGFKAVEDLGDAYEKNPQKLWTKEIRRSDIEGMFPEIGELKGIRVTLRNGLGAWGGRTRQLVFLGTKADATLDIANWRGDQFRKKFSLKSDWYQFPQFPDYSDPGFWLAKSNGGVLAVGTAKHFGDAKKVKRAGDIVDIAGIPTAGGYWLVSSAGEVFSYGDAQHHGDLAAVSLAAPIVAITPHPDGRGYWLASGDGGVFTFGSASYYGSMGEVALNKPVVGMEVTRSGKGYWLVASDGGIFSFGDAQFYGSTGGIQLNMPITSMAAAPDGKGYWFVASDGGVFAFGSVGFFGSRGGDTNRRPTSGMAVSNTGEGYWLVWDDGVSFPFGDTPDFRSSVAKKTVVAIEVVP